MAKLSVIIPAAGSGVRMGAEVPKPFLRLGDKSILEHTISRFLHLSNVRQVIIAASRGYIPKIESLISGFESDADFIVVEGGNERQYSIQNALEKVGDEIDLVAIHDGVRPFIRPALIRKCCEVAAQVGGGVIGVPAKDTIKKADAAGIIVSTPGRSELWQAQTPQVFQKKLLKEAYKSALKDKFVGTDDASLVERIGGKVQMVKGDRENLKITYPIDLKIAELILADQE